MKYVYLIVYSRRESEIMVITREMLGSVNEIDRLYVVDDDFYDDEYLKNYIESYGNAHVESYVGEYDLIDGVFNE